MNTNFRVDPVENFRGATEHQKRWSCIFRTVCSQEKVELHFFKAIFDTTFDNAIIIIGTSRYQFQAFVAVFRSKELICANGKHVFGTKFTVLNCAFHSPKKSVREPTGLPT